MNCEEYLTKHISTLDSFKKMTLEDFIQLDMFIFRDIDIDCDLNNPLYASGSEKYVSRKDGIIYLSNIIFTNYRKTVIDKCKNKKLYFRNCIILSAFIFESSPETIVFDNCCFKSIRISPVFRKAEFYSSIIEKIVIDPGSDKLVELSINTVEIGCLKCFGTDASKFRFYKNKIHKIVLENVQNLNSFDYTQLPFLTGSVKNDNIIENIDSKNKDEILFTLNFFENLDGLKEDAVFCNDIENLKLRYLEKSKDKSVVLFLCGNFRKPIHMLLEALITIIIFSILFMIGKDFRISTTYLSSIEESIKSFCRFDMPKGLSTWKMILSYVESFFGFLEISVFTISLGKKYLK